MNKCNKCKHKSEVDIYSFQVCITCENNPFVITDRFEAKEKEIRPENAGELWQKSCDNFVYMIAEQGINKLMAIPSSCDLSPFSLEEGCGKKMIHNKNGWALLYSPTKQP